MFYTLSPQLENSLHFEFIRKTQHRRAQTARTLAKRKRKNLSQLPIGRKVPGGYYHNHVTNNVFYYQHIEDKTPFHYQSVLSPMYFDLRPPTHYNQKLKYSNPLFIKTLRVDTIPNF